MGRIIISILTCGRKVCDAAEGAHVGDTASVVVDAPCARAVCVVQPDGCGERRPMAVVAADGAEARQVPVTLRAPLMRVLGASIETLYCAASTTESGHRLQAFRHLFPPPQSPFPLAASSTQVAQIGQRAAFDGT